MSEVLFDGRTLELVGTGPGWVTVAEARLKASDRGIEPVSDLEEAGELERWF